MSQFTQSDADLLDAVLDSDPRVTRANVRHVDGDPAAVVLVGVVHDHPASVYRARTVVETAAPETVAVELPHLMVPAVEEAAQDVSGEARSEMAAAIAASSGSVAGIDVPGRGFVRSVFAELRAERPSVATTVRAFQDVARITKRALLGWLAGVGVPGTPEITDIEHRHEYDLSTDVAPADQADHERAHVRRGTTLLRSFEPPSAAAFLDGVRERQMAARLQSLRQHGPVVGVVGYGHLDEIEAMLKNRNG